MIQVEDNIFSDGWFNHQLVLDLGGGVPDFYDPTPPPKKTGWQGRRIPKPEIIWSFADFLELLTAAWGVLRCALAFTSLDFFFFSEGFFYGTTPLSSNESHGFLLGRGVALFFLGGREPNPNKFLKDTQSIAGSFTKIAGKLHQKKSRGEFPIEGGIFLGFSSVSCPEGTAWTELSRSKRWTYKVYIYIDKWSTSGWIEERWKTNIIGLENCYLPKWIYTNNSWHSLYMMIINCIYIFLFNLHFIQVQWFELNFFLWQVLFEFLLMKRLNKMPQPIQTHSAFANKGLIDEEHTGEALYEQEWVGIFWGIFFGSVIEMCKSGWNSQKFVEHLPALVYLRYVHL